MLFLQPWTSLAFLATTTYAYSVFGSHCSLPQHTVNYVESVNLRGSLDIIWTCLTTLVACTYTILHLGVPSQPLELSSRWRAYRPLHHAFMTGLAFLGTTMFPDLALCASIIEWFSVHNALKELNISRPETRRKVKMDWRWRVNLMLGLFDGRRVPEQEVTWTATHFFAANMGVFVLRYRRPQGGSGKPLSFDKEAARQSMENRGTAHKPTDADAQLVMPLPNERSAGDTACEKPAIVPANDELDAAVPINAGLSSDNTFVNLQSLAEVTGNIQQGSPVEETKSESDTDLEVFDVPPSENDCLYRLNARSLRHLIEKGHLSSDVPLSEEDLEGRSKGDWFVKLLVILQLLYFAVTVISRLAESLPVTTMEVGVCGYVFCATLSYFFLLWKPKSVRTVITLRTLNRLPTEIQASDDERAKKYAKISRLVTVVNSLNIDSDKKPLDSMNDLAALALTTSSGIAFAAIHLAGWNLSFPSDADRWVWRAASLATCAGPTLALLIGGPAVYFLKKCEADLDIREKKHSMRSISSVFLVTLCLPISVLGFTAFWGRIALLVEMVRQLFYLPPAAFLTPGWPFDIPHIG